MASIYVSGDRLLNMLNGLNRPALPDFLDGVEPSVTYDAQTMTLSYGTSDDGSEVTFDGSFSYSNDGFSDSLSAGTITSVRDTYWWHDYDVTPEVYHSDTLSISNISISVASYLSMTPAQFMSAILTGNDSVEGGNRNDHLEGLAGNDTLLGFSGNDTLVGGSGADRMDGGGGNDLYSVDNAGDVILEGAGGGTDTIYTSVLFSLAATPQVENLRVLGTADLTLRGNALNNLLSGNEGSNIFIGGKGTDTASFSYAGAGVAASLASRSATGAGDDFFVSIENLVGSGFADRLTGDGAANTIWGGAGADTLAGGGGRDVLVGQAGADVFDFNAAADSGATSATRDLIYDFGAGDRIDLRTIDAVTGGANNSFEFIAAAGTASSAVGTGKIGWYQVNAAGTANDRTFLRLNVDSDATIEMTIEIVGLHTMGTGFFLL